MARIDWKKTAKANADTKLTAASMKRGTYSVVIDNQGVTRAPCPAYAVHEILHVLNAAQVDSNFAVT